MTNAEMTDKEHAKKYAEESISLAISMSNPKAEDIAFFACLYGLTYKNPKIKELEQQIEKMKCCGNCNGHCSWTSESIKDGKRTSHYWNKEKKAYCDVGKGAEYQLWEMRK